VLTAGLTKSDHSKVYYFCCCLTVKRGRVPPSFDQVVLEEFNQTLIVIDLLVRVEFTDVD